MNPATNIFTREGYGAPAGRHGSLGLWLNTRKLWTQPYVPNRWERMKIRGWRPYYLPIPSQFPGIWQLDGNDTQEFIGTAPVYFACVGIGVFSLQPEGANVKLYSDQAEQAFIYPNGPDLHIDNLGGTGKNPFFLKEPYFMDPGDSILCDLTNLSDNPNQGQIVLYGFSPRFPGLVPTQPKPVPAVWPQVLR